MKTQIMENEIELWLSAKDTRDWANRPGEHWPCSTLSGHRLMVVFDRCGLLEITIDGSASRDCDGHELSCMVYDVLKCTLSKDHPAYWVIVGQFDNDAVRS